MSFPLIIPVISLLHFPSHLAFGEVYSFEPPNLKTVLFKETDLLTRCWSKHEVNLLLNRRVMQDLIPRKIPRDFPLLLKYLQNLEHLAEQIPQGLNQTLVMSAMADVLGGYLSAIVLPIAKEAYYAGSADYHTVHGLHTMLDRWKWYLSTDGGTWSQQCDMRRIPTKVTALQLNLNDPDGACKQLYVAASHDNNTQHVGSQTMVAENSRIAIPYFDNNLSPNAIALPFRSHNLFGLMDPNATYILVMYYTLSMRCLSGNANDVMAFSNFFHVWIMSKVVPHLHDQDRWYPALGGVMQVVETIRQKGLAPANTVFVPPLSDDHMDSVLTANIDVENADSSIKHTGVMGSYFHLYNNPYAIVVLMVLFVISSLLLCCCCICLWMLCRRRRKKHILLDTDENMLKNALVSIYCGLKDALRDSRSESDTSRPEGQRIRPSDPPQRVKESDPSQRMRNSSPRKDSSPKGNKKRPSLTGELPNITLVPHRPADPKSDTEADTTSEGSLSGSSPSDEDIYSSSTRPQSSK